MALNEIKISDLGILSVARKISDSRRYDSGLIDIVGNVRISGNYASEFSTDSYLYKSGILLSGEEISITYTTKFISTKPNRDQLGFLLKNSFQDLELHFNNSQITFLVNSEVANQLSYLDIADGEEIDIVISIRNETCNMSLYFQERLIENTAQLSSPLDFSEPYELFLGGEPDGLNI